MEPGQAVLLAIVAVLGVILVAAGLSAADWADRHLRGWSGTVLAVAVVAAMSALMCALIGGWDLVFR